MIQYYSTLKRNWYILKFNMITRTVHFGVNCKVNVLNWLNLYDDHHLH